MHGAVGDHPYASPFGRQMAAMFEQDFAHAEALDPAEFDRKPFWWRFGVSLSRLAAPVL